MDVFDGRSCKGLPSTGGLRSFISLVALVNVRSLHVLQKHHSGLNEDFSPVLGPFPFLFDGFGVNEVY